MRSSAKLKIVPAAPKAEMVVIEAPRFERAVIKIKGTAPYVQNKFSHKIMEQIAAKQSQGSRANKGKARTPKDFKAIYEGAMYLTKDGKHGIPASCFRNAMISACRLVGFKMTLAKLSLFVEADGYDQEDHIPLIYITGKCHSFQMMGRNDDGSADIKTRPMWDEWSANVRIRWDSAQFAAKDVVNLMSRVGQQVGIGEGRPDSKNSAGMGWGLFEVIS